MRSDAARNRALILAAARTLIAAQGPEASMDAIAASAGVAVGTLYRHFPTKADLVAATLEVSIGRFAEVAEKAVARVERGGSLPDEVVALFHSFVELKADDQALKSASVQLGVAIPIDDLTAFAEGSAMQRAVRATRTMLTAAQSAGIVRADLSFEDLGMLLFSAPGAEVSVQARQRYVQIMVAGLRPES